MARFIGTNKSDDPLTGKLASLTRWGALAPFGQGAFQFISENTTFVVPPNVNHIRVRLCGAGGGMKVAGTHNSISFSRFDGGDTAFGDNLVAPGGKAAVGNVGGLGGVVSSNAQLTASGGAGGDISFGDGVFPPARLGGGGAAGSQLGDGGNGGNNESVSGGNEAAGGSCGNGNADGLTAAHPLIGFEQRLVGSGGLVTDQEAIPRFIGDHFAELWVPPYTEGGVFQPYGKCVQMSYGIGYGFGIDSYAPEDGFKNPYEKRHSLIGSGVPRYTAKGGAPGSVSITVEEGNNNLATYNDQIFDNRAKAGGGGPSSGGGAWCMTEMDVNPNSEIACTIGKTDPFGGGGDGYVVVEW